MAKVQVVSAMTSDGSLPAKDDPFLLWVENDRHGFSRWRDSADRVLEGNISFISLINEQRMPDAGSTYLAELLSESQLPLIKGLLLYGLVDEIILYILPGTGSGEVCSFPFSFPPDGWEMQATRAFSNGICRRIYHKET